MVRRLPADRDFPMLIDLYLQGRLPLDKFVSETIASTTSRRPSTRWTRRSAALGGGTEVNGDPTSARRHFDGAQYAEIYPALGNPGIKALDRLMASGDVLHPDRGRYVARAPTTQTVPQGSRECQCPQGRNRACGVVISPRRRHEGGTGGRQRCQFGQATGVPL